MQLCLPLFQRAMADILLLRGAPAFSSFRLQGLQQRVAAAVPRARIAAAEYWHFGATRRALSDAERRQLDRLLDKLVRHAQACDTGEAE